MEIVVNKSAAVLLSGLLAGIVAGSGVLLAAEDPPPIKNPGGLQLLVADEHASPTLRVVLPGRPTSERAIEVIFPEHVTAIRHGSTEAEQLYRWRPGLQGDRPVWRRLADALEYERDLPGGVHLLARATLEADGVRFHYEFRSGSTNAYDMIYAVTDPRLTDGFQDLRLERTYVHYPGGFALLAAGTPARLTLPLDRWLPARYLASFTWPVPTEQVERRADGITYYNTARAVDQPFIATRSANRAWVVASFARNPGNVWTNPELTCQHVDPQAVLPPGQAAVLEMKMLVLRGSLEDALRLATAQRDSLK
jgi:hypothetical protein